jgi:hypothetical protein
MTKAALPCRKAWVSNTITNYADSANALKLSSPTSLDTTTQNTSLASLTPSTFRAPNNGCHGNTVVLDQCKDRQTTSTSVFIDGEIQLSF